MTSPNQKLKEFYMRGKEVSAAPASEPEMREQVAREVFSIIWNDNPDGPYHPAFERDADLWFKVADGVMPIIARHLAERDARIAELEADVREAVDQVRANIAAIDEAMAFVRTAEDRARVAEAALAAEREACALTAEWCAQCAWSREGKREAERVAVLIRARSTITAEGAETGRAEHAR